MAPSFTDPATPLAAVTFVVLDLETTGASPDGCAITEVGALKFRGGECLGTFQTLVDPGVPIPPDIVYLTGITEAMVAPAPTIESVLPAFAEFIGDAVVVGHNVRFDLGFLRANLARLGYRALTNRSIDTLALARRLVRDDVENHKLGTLARHFATDADACHRALDDARATAEIFHLLLEQVGTIGITSLDDLLALPTTAGHPYAAKLRWVAPLPRSLGLYVFRDVTGQVLYVGRARDLRRRVRSYFTGIERRRTMPLLREAASLTHVPCRTDLEAAVLELRLLHRHRPRYNRQVEAWDRARHLRIGTRSGRPARPVVVRAGAADDGCRYAGPFPSPAAARTAASAFAEGNTAALVRVLRRQERTDALIRAGRVEVEVDGDTTFVIDAGRLVVDAAAPTPDVRPATGGAPAPVSATLAEAALLAAWLDGGAARCRITSTERGWARLVRPEVGVAPEGQRGDSSAAGD